MHCIPTTANIVVTLRCLVQDKSSLKGKQASAACFTAEKPGVSAVIIRDLGHTFIHCVRALLNDACFKYRLNDKQQSKGSRQIQKGEGEDLEEPERGFSNRCIYMHCMR